MRDLVLMEKQILELLQFHANDDYAKDELAPLIAKTSLEMGHLYSDLGLASRKEMGELMSKNFTSLANVKPDDVRWKKYLYDCIGKTAPACATCGDISNCFNCTLNPNREKTEVKKSKILEGRFATGNKDLVILVSFEVTIFLMSFFLIY
jgi:nitrogen fixation protein NifQ